MNEDPKTLQIKDQVQRENIENVIGIFHSNISYMELSQIFVGVCRKPNLIFDSSPIKNVRDARNISLK